MLSLTRISKMRFLHSVLFASIGILAACKKEPAPAPAPAPLAQSVAPPAALPPPQNLQPSRTVNPNRGRETPIPGLDPSKSIVGRDPRRLPRGFSPGLARRLAHLGSSLAIVGKGTVSAEVDKVPLQLPVTVGRRGGLYVLSGEKADLGLVLSLAAINPGTYTRSSADTQPNLQLRLGAQGQGEVLAASEPSDAPTLTVQIGESGRSVRGTFEGRVSRDGGKVAKMVKQGRFEFTVETTARGLGTTPPVPTAAADASRAAP
jgi:hypothetical protein